MRDLKSIASVSIQMPSGDCRVLQFEEIAELSASGRVEIASLEGLRRSMDFGEVDVTTEDGEILRRVRIVGIECS